MMTLRASILFLIALWPALAHALSADGTISIAPNGAAITTADGTWTWGAAVAGRPGEYNLKLNGAPNSSIGLLMEVVGGQLYVNTAKAGWWRWDGSNSVLSGAPGAPGPPGPTGPPASLTLGLPVVGSPCNPADSEFQTNRTVSPMVLNLFVCDQTAKWAGPFKVTQ
jgi:hypothetical protein